MGDLFAGAGGISAGFHQAGFQTVFCNEIDGIAAETYRHNFPSATRFVCPIEELTAERLHDESALDGDDLDVLAGGPPCQGFSINAPVRTDEDPRNALFRHYVRLVLEGVRPAFIVLENVPGMVSYENGRTIRDVREAFEQAGYRVFFRILNAAHYGVPEERWRLFFVGTRLPDVEFQFPPPVNFSTQRANFTGAREYASIEAIRNTGEQPRLFGESLLPPLTVREAIGDLPPIVSGGGAQEMPYELPPLNDYQAAMREQSTMVLNHECAGLSKANLERMTHVPPGGSWRDIPFELLPEGMKRARRSAHTRRYGRLHPDGLSGTIMTKCDPHWGTVVHYDQDRVISVREAARLQSFPDSFRFMGSKADQYRQVGNAVPPLLARAIAEQIRYALEQCHD